MLFVTTLEIFDQVHDVSDRCGNDMSLRYDRISARDRHGLVNILLSFIGPAIKTVAHPMMIASYYSYKGFVTGNIARLVCGLRLLTVRAAVHCEVIIFLDVDTTDVVRPNLLRVQLS